MDRAVVGVAVVDESCGDEEGGQEEEPQEERWQATPAVQRGLLVVRAGGRGGGMSGVIGGWTAQRNPQQVQIVSQEITP